MVSPLANVNQAIFARKKFWAKDENSVNWTEKLSRKTKIPFLLLLNSTNSPKDFFGKNCPIQNFYMLFCALTLTTPCISESCINMKINLNLYFQTSLSCLKRFYKGCKVLHRTVWGTTKKCENKNLS